MLKILILSLNGKSKKKLILFLGDFNTFIIFFFMLLTTLILHTNTALHLLLTAELLWITLYGLALFVGLAFDNLNILSLTFFFLIFSAVEFAVGLVLLLLQHLLTRSISLETTDSNVFKNMSRTNVNLKINLLRWRV